MKEQWQMDIKDSVNFRKQICQQFTKFTNVLSYQCFPLYDTVSCQNQIKGQYFTKLIY